MQLCIKDNDTKGLNAANNSNNASKVTNDEGNVVSPKIKNVAQELELIFKREVGLTAGRVVRDDSYSGALLFANMDFTQIRVCNLDFFQGRS